MNVAVPFVDLAVGINPVVLAADNPSAAGGVRIVKDLRVVGAKCRGYLAACVKRGLT